MKIGWVSQTLKAIALRVRFFNTKVRMGRRILTFAIAFLTGLCLMLWGVSFKASGAFNLISSQPAAAQIVTSQDLWQQVYQRLPDFPLENQYVNKETGEVASNNTLASRLIQYHQYVKNRPLNYRLDWKLTLADYLGANEYLVEAQYPGSDTLRQNPMESDRIAINRLNRLQRNALVDVLVKIFNPNYQDTPTPASPVPAETPTPETRGILRLPQPGDAQLLKP